MDFAIRHYIPGRVRAHAPGLCVRPKLAEATLAWLRKLPGVTSARANYDCHCLVIEYDKRSDGVLRKMIGHLRGVTIEELRALVGVGRTTEETVRVEPPSGQAQPAPSCRAPLVLPTVSLAMAFSANPLVQAVNFPLMAWNAYPIALRAWRVWSREGRLNIDFLDVLAISASIAQAIRWPGRSSPG
jgi:Cu2+-exporting ATPase